MTDRAPCRRLPRPLGDVFTGGKERGGLLAGGKGHHTEPQDRRHRPADQPDPRLRSEREPADRFRGSRPMLREAMRALAVLGVIEIRPGGGAWISALDASSLLSPLNVFLGLSEISLDRLCQALRLMGGALAARQAKAADLEALDPPVAGGGRSLSRFRFPRPASQAGRSLFPCPRRPEPGRTGARIPQGRRPYRRDGAPVHCRIGEAPRAGDASRQAMAAHMAQARTSPLGISQTLPAKGFSRMTGAQA
ncbi:FadR family transcriptional regulator [Rhodovulum sulfidophilum]|nr:FadR family transcriptional regulator [Rhodovulum sulfidophilum]